mgnify:CR=1 FL=1
MYLIEVDEEIPEQLGRLEIVQTDAQRKILSLATHYHNLLNGRTRRGRKLKLQDNNFILRVERGVSLEL